MPKALAVGSVDLIQAVLHFADILDRAGIQGLLYHRLFGTRTSAKGLRPRWIASQTGIDCDQPVGSGQQADEGIIELVNWRMLDGFLPHLHRGADRAKETLVDSLSLQWLPSAPPG